MSSSYLFLDCVRANLAILRLQLSNFILCLLDVLLCFIVLLSLFVPSVLSLTVCSSAESLSENKARRSLVLVVKRPLRHCTVKNPRIPDWEVRENQKCSSAVRKSPQSRSAKSKRLRNLRWLRSLLGLTTLHCHNHPSLQLRIAERKVHGVRSPPAREALRVRHQNVSTPVNR